MKIVDNPLAAFAHTNQWKQDGLRIGFVPTMGALHAGHLALVRRSQQECDITVVSIFVNPTQFGPHEDFSKYPRPLEEDLRSLRELGIDLAFVPTPEQLYPPDFSTYVQPPKSSESLEGEFRPGHFRGVVTVVLKLFQIIPAHVGYFGLKDFQQWTVIRHMVEDLNLPIRVEGCETIRESDGLAMSSRNRYLDDDQRQRALGLWKALQAARRMVDSRVLDVAKIEGEMSTVLKAEGADQVEYARIVDRDSLRPLHTIDRPVVALIAARVGTTRLIDNLLLDAPSP